MEEFTPAQSKSIETWSEQRDSLLRDISILQTQKNSLAKEVTDESLNLNTIRTEIAEARGVISVLNEIEERYKVSLNTEIAELEVRKSRLEEECLNKENLSKSADEELARINSLIKTLLETHSNVSIQANVITKVVNEVMLSGGAFVETTKDTLTEVKALTNDIIEKGNENVDKTNIVLDALPKYIFALSKPEIMRRPYISQKGNIINPEVIDSEE